ncbi:(deoxy)nucleoside triphosphate pyrophosphohydrolase [Tepidimonas sp.]|uniref:(deoxy)nucleoside triphosphate pyrophosphohydrolase n=1 Tax=Tepidimonas sp. TaxID=2002775 RepID=UPI002FE2DECA
MGPCACPSEGAEAVLVVDAQQPRPAGPRQPVDVAVGLLIDAQGRFLMTTRPPGKAYAGYWEFPGGKVEAGETVQQALQRELREEIGIEIGAAQPWQTLVVDYPHALVRLHVCRITRWQGELRMHEGQDCAWQTLPVTVAPVLPGTVPLLQALGQAA